MKLADYWSKALSIYALGVRDKGSEMKIPKDHKISLKSSSHYINTSIAS